MVSLSPLSRFLGSVSCFLLALRGFPVASCVLSDWLGLFWVVWAVLAIVSRPGHSHGLGFRGLFWLLLWLVAQTGSSSGSSLVAKTGLVAKTRRQDTACFRGLVARTGLILPHDSHRSTNMHKTKITGLGQVSKAFAQFHGLARSLRAHETSNPNQMMQANTFTAKKKLQNCQASGFEAKT